MNYFQNSTGILPILERSVNLIRFFDYLYLIQNVAQIDPQFFFPHAHQCLLAIFENCRGHSRHVTERSWGVAFCILKMRKHIASPQQNIARIKENVIDACSYTFVKLSETTSGGKRTWKVSLKAICHYLISKHFHKIEFLYHLLQGNSFMILLVNVHVSSWLMSVISLPPGSIWLVVLGRVTLKSQRMFWGSPFRASFAEDKEKTSTLSSRSRSDFYLLFSLQM